MKQPRIAVLIPCYNEVATIARVVTDFRAALPEASIYVYDNNSTDGTSAAAVAAGAILGDEPEQGKGAVVNLASIEGLLGHHPDRIGTIAYNTAKGAVINMTRALAAEWGPKNIRVNALAPGFFPSRMTMATVDEHGAEMLHQTPLGKLGGETDLMGAALLLASDAGDHITGQTIVVDGGATII